MFDISPLNSTFDKAIAEKINHKTKPLGALGKLEDLAFQLAKIQQTAAKQDNLLTRLEITSPQLMVFAGDHGVAAQGVSIAPSEVTGQMVANFAHGGAAINVFCREFGWQLSVVDAGILQASQLPQVIEQRLGNGTYAINQSAAMDKAQVLTGFEFANKLIAKKAQLGCNLIAFGEMGIGNTTIASALMAAIMKISASRAVGKGTGVSDDVVAKKIQVVEQALSLHYKTIFTADQQLEPIALLACLGGFEIVQITGAMLAAATHGMTIVVDGFICTAAAMVAKLIKPSVQEYMIFAHCSGEQGHQQMLQWFGAEPLLNLGLRLGEGTGAALSLPLINAARGFYNDMASFTDAAVTDVVN